MNRPDIPVYLGEELPLVRPYVDAMDTHGEDGLGESNYPEITNQIMDESGVEFLTHTLKNAAQTNDPVSIIALGPLTNLAKVIQEDPQSLAGLGELISMGGKLSKVTETVHLLQNTTTGVILMQQKSYTVHLKTCLSARIKKFIWSD